MRSLPLLVFLALSLSLARLTASDAGTYRLIRTTKVGGEGSFDYVYADGQQRKLYIPRGNRVTVFDLDSLKPAGEIPELKSAHGVAVDPKSHHGFSSSVPVAMWDADTLKTLKTIPVEGSPDGILFDPATQRVFVLSHRAPHATVINAQDGSIVGTIDLGGAPEQAVSDGKGRIYIDIEDKDRVAVVDSRAMRVLTQFELGGKGGTPAGLAMDTKNRVLFVCCRNPATMVILNADNGYVITALPIGAGSDGGTFNPTTMEAFSSNRDGTLTVVKETSPTSFAVAQTVTTKAGAKTCTLDQKTGRILLITAEYGPPSADQPKKGKGGRGAMIPDSFGILEVSR